MTAGTLAGLRGMLPRKHEVHRGFPNLAQVNLSQRAALAERGTLRLAEVTARIVVYPTSPVIYIR